MTCMAARACGALVEFEDARTELGGDGLDEEVVAQQVEVLARERRLLIDLLVR